MDIYQSNLPTSTSFDFSNQMDVKFDSNPKEKTILLNADNFHQIEFGNLPHEETVAFVNEDSTLISEEDFGLSSPMQSTRIPFLLQSLRQHMVTALREVYSAGFSHIDVYEVVHSPSHRSSITDSNDEELLFEYHKLKIMTTLSLTDFRDYLLVLMPLLSGVYDSSVGSISLYKIIHCQLEFIRNRHTMIQQIRDSFLKNETETELRDFLRIHKTQSENVSFLARLAQSTFEDSTQLYTMELDACNSNRTVENEIFERALRNDELFRLSEAAAGQYGYYNHASVDRRRSFEFKTDGLESSEKSCDDSSTTAPSSQLRSGSCDYSQSADELNDFSSIPASSSIDYDCSRIVLNDFHNAWQVLWKEKGCSMQRNFSVEEFGYAGAEAAAREFLEEILRRDMVNVGKDSSSYASSKSRNGKRRSFQNFTRSRNGVFSNRKANTNFKQPRVSEKTEDYQIPYETYPKKTVRKNLVGKDHLHSNELQVIGNSAGSNSHNDSSDFVVKFDCIRQGWLCCSSNKQGLTQSKFFPNAKYGCEKALSLAQSWKRTTRQLHKNASLIKRESKKLGMKRTPGRPRNSAGTKQLRKVKLENVAKPMVSNSKTIPNEKGPPGGLANLSKASTGVLYRQDSSTTRIERLSSRAMEFPYVHGVTFEAENFAWVATVGGDTRRYLVKKHGWEKARNCAVERVMERRKHLDPEKLLREREQERQVLATLSSAISDTVVRHEEKRMQSPSSEVSTSLEFKKSVCPVKQMKESQLEARNYFASPSKSLKISTDEPHASGVGDSKEME